MKKIKAAIFDLDGTIINTLVDLANAGNTVLERLGFPTHPVEKYNFFVGSGILRLSRRILPDDRKDDEELVQEVFRQFNEEYGAHYMDNTCAYEGMEDTLLKLRDMGIQCAVLTNKSHEFTVPMVKKVYGDYPFSVVLGKTDRFPVKPDRGVIKYVIDEMGVTPDECIYIGDSNVDMMTARNGEIEEIIGVSWGFRPVDELVESDAKYIIDSPDEIIDVIEKIESEKENLND